MNAHKFVAEKGIEEAKRVLNGAPDWAFGYDYIDDEYFKGADIQDGYSIDQCEECVCVDDIKRIVESVDLVKRYGGVEAIENLFHVNSDGQAKIMRVSYLTWHDAKQAIADYELVESHKQVKCEVLDMVDVSPNCEVRNG